ncbi:hypothetical protein HPB47_004835 [Ixodes persulcatus]|uniref:Uncharacterized protein n=1 Tax=Ixodes persulcatus TaxID=34615 RepID=A0AC60PES2_IXOPE|nr:hypothetical protein HPB47_004835 [Ixodes persulcatus]
MSHVWMVTCTKASAKAKLVNKAELCVKGHRCIVIDPDTRDVKLKLLWLPVHMENKRIEEALAPYEDEYPLLKLTEESSCSQQPLPRRERSTTSSGASVKRPAPKAESSQPSGMGAEKESKKDEGGEAKCKPAALREDPHSLASQPDNEMKDNEVLPT